MSTGLDKPDVQIVVTIPRQCDKDTVKAVRAACDGIVAAMDASEYRQEDRGIYGSSYSSGYTAYHFTRSIRFEVEPEPQPAEAP